MLVNRKAQGVTERHLGELRRMVGERVHVTQTIAEGTAAVRERAIVPMREVRHKYEYEYNARFGDRLVAPVFALTDFQGPEFPAPTHVSRVAPESWP